ncbi:MAG: helix-turn-helix domain-containing protein [Gemmatimonas sp.]
MNAITRPFQYVEMEAAPSLGDVVMTYWAFTINSLPSPDFMHQVWPDGCVSLAMSFGEDRCYGAVIVGPRIVASPVAVHAGERYFGIRFRPEAGAVSCARDASTLRDEKVFAREIFGERIDELTRELANVHESEAAARVMDAWLERVRVAPEAIDATVREAVQYIVRADGTCSMQDVADAVHLTLRQLQRRFRSATGLTPKEYANIRRARTALKLMLSGERTAGRSRAFGGWARLAAESGFADQAHLAKECARLLQLTPTAVSNRLSDISHTRLVD